MKCPICGEVFISHFYLYSHHYEKHVNVTKPEVQYLYGTPENVWIDPRPRASRNNRRLGRPPLIVYPANNTLKVNETKQFETDLTTGNGMLRDGTLRDLQSYTYKELRAILRFYKYHYNK